jgi:hypothetical protein
MRTSRGGQGQPNEGGIHTAKAVALIAVLALIGIVVLAKSTPSAGSKGASSHSTTTRTTLSTSSPTHVSVPPTTVVPPANVKLQVLNGVGSGSYSGLWSAKLKANPGYNTLPPADAPTVVASSEIFVITPGYQAEARALATTVGLPASAINPSVPPPATAPITVSSRTNANLVLVVGPDLTSTA